MPRFHDYRRQDERLVTFWCPGCEDHHALRVEGANIWTWNGDFDKATFNPSLLVRYGDPDKPGEYVKVCHSFIRDGRIEFLGDCTHKLRGQTVDVPEHEPLCRSPL